MNNKSIINTFSFWQAVICGGLLVAFFIYQDVIRRKFTIFLMPFIYIILIMLVVVSVVISIVFLLNNCKIKLSNAYLPLVINIICVAFVLICPLDELKRDNNFYKYLENREKVIEKIIEKELIPNEQGTILLPNLKQYKNLSEENRVALLQYNNCIGIYFYTFSGLLESSSGYIYFTNKLVFEGVESDLKIIKSYNKGWYFCSTY